MFQLNCILLTYSLIFGVQTQNLYEETSRLKRYLFTNHDQNIRPVKNNQNAVRLDFRVKVDDAFLQDFILTSRITLRLTWLDEILQWQSGNYTNITHLHLKETDLWTPRFQVRNPVSESSFQCFDKVVKIYNDGKVEFDCWSTSRVSCETAFVRFPFDEHDCEILLYLPDYNTEEVQIRTTTMERRNTEQQSRSWEMKNPSVRSSEFHHSNSAALLVTLQLSRNFMFDLVFTILPVMLVSLLVPLTFLVQDNAVKVMYSLLVFLLMILLVFQIMPNLPRSINCAFNLYIGCLLFLNFTGIIVAVAMYKYSYQSPQLQKPPTPPTDERPLHDFLYDFRNPHNFLFYEKMLKKLMNRGCFTCCLPSVEDAFSDEWKTYFKSKTNKKKCSNHKLFIVFLLLWSALTALYLVKTFEII